MGEDSEVGWGREGGRRNETGGSFRDFCLHSTLAGLIGGTQLIPRSGHVAEPCTGRDAGTLSLTSTQLTTSIKPLTFPASRGMS